MLPPYRSIPTVGQVFNEPCSWFGDFGPWADPDDDGQNASGLPETVPGIAFYCEATLRRWWLVSFPNGQGFVVPQVDVGPGPETGRGIDVNTALAVKAGYIEKTFPTGATLTFKYLGDKPS